MIIILLMLFIGKTVEENHVERAQSTVDLYNKSQVCALQNIPDNVYNNITENSIRQRSPAHRRHLQQQDSSFLQTVDNITVARQEPNTLVAHCGDCGKCSSPHDVLIYDETKNTLTDTTTKCAKMALIGGRRRATKCMEESVGLSPECTDCWVDNIMCDVRYCVFTCLWRLMTSWGDSKSVGGALNACTKCDEMRCGRAFLTCAGANRRRTGILSDIERDFDQEVCQNADEAFWGNEQVQLWYQSLDTSNNKNETTNAEPDDNDNTRSLRGLPS